MLSGFQRFVNTFDQETSFLFNVALNDDAVVPTPECDWQCSDFHDSPDPSLLKTFNKPCS
jgi:hypothetical protein